MEQKNLETGRQEAGPIGGSQNGGQNNHQRLAASGCGGAFATGVVVAGANISAGVAVAAGCVGPADAVSGFAGYTGAGAAGSSALGGSASCITAGSSALGGSAGCIGAGAGGSSPIGGSAGCIVAGSSAFGGSAGFIAACTCARAGAACSSAFGGSAGCIAAGAACSSSGCIGSGAGATGSSPLGGSAGCIVAGSSAFGGSAGFIAAGSSALGGAAGCIVAGANGASAGPSSPPVIPWRRQNHPRTSQLINAMEAYFKDHPNTNKLQLNELARRLQLNPAHVKCWFQNKRAQVKRRSEREESEALRSRNDVLRAQKQQLREAVSKNTCPQCGAQGCRLPVHVNELSLENIRLREKLKSTAARFRDGHNYLQNLSTSQHPQNLAMTFQQNAKNLPIISQKPQNLPVIPQNPQGLPIISQNPQNVPVISEAENSNPYLADLGLRYASTSIPSTGEGVNLINAVPTSHKFRKSLIELAVSSAEELKVMAMAAGPLWISNSADGATSMLNEVAYLATFPSNIVPTRSGYTCEASRHIARVSLNPTQLRNILMNVNEWAFTFSSIVSSASTFDALREGIDYDAALQVIAAEYHIPTPLVPNRDTYFVRYCTKHSKGVWAVVDVSVDNILPTPKIMTCQKKPSGCVIQEMADGTSKITWIEHVYVDHNGVSTMYKRLLLSGLGFGAQRWVSTLERHCQRLRTSMSTNVPSTPVCAVMSNPEARRGVLKLAKRMVDSFFFGINSPESGRWTTVKGNFGDNVRLMSKRVMGEPGPPNGTILSLTTSFMLPLAPKMVFDFFCDVKSRKKWKIFPVGDGYYEPVFHISYGQEAANCVSMHKIPGRRHRLLLQESWSDPVASYVVYSPTEIGIINAILGGGNPDALPLLPSGFTILPDGPLSRLKGSTGTLLTVSFQLRISESSVADIDLTVAAKVAHLFRCNCEKIKRALSAVGPNSRT